MKKLEECARALCELEGGKWDAQHMGETMCGNEPEEAHESYREQARAVIRCLMEPNEEMMRAGGFLTSDEVIRAMLQSVLDEGKE